MKKFVLNIQTKGGSGKSMLTYLFAVKNDKNERSLFVDFDSGTKTSEKQLEFLKGRVPPRFLSMHLLDEKQRVIRDKFFAKIEQLVAQDYDTYYMDFGAPESEQFPSLLSIDFSAGNLKTFEQTLNIKFVFNIVVAGGTAFMSCTDFVKKLSTALGGLFEVNLFVNEFTFLGFESLKSQVDDFAKIAKLKVYSFGNFDMSADTSKGVLTRVKNGEGITTMSLMEKLLLTNEVEKLPNF